MSKELPCLGFPSQFAHRGHDTLVVLAIGSLKENMAMSWTMFLFHWVNFYLIESWFLSGIIFCGLFSVTPWRLGDKKSNYPSCGELSPRAAVSSPFYSGPLRKPLDPSGGSITHQALKSKPLSGVESAAGSGTVQKHGLNWPGHKCYAFICFFL